MRRDGLSWLGGRRTLVIATALTLVALISACTQGQGGGGGGTHPGPVSTITVGAQTVTVSVPAGRTVVVTPAGPATLPALPDGMSGPIGALAINVGNVVPAGSAVQVSIALPTPVDAVVKLIGSTWDPFEPDGTTGATLSPDGRTITVDLVDGGRGDADGVANGVIADPIEPIDLAVAITSANPTPGYTVGQPYSHQLLAVGPVPGDITWSVIARELPHGLSLDPSGLVSGTPTDPFGGGYVRVQATDGVTSDTKLLSFGYDFVQPSPGPALSVPTGAPLPEGTRIIFSEQNFGGGQSSQVGMVHADGSITGDLEEIKQYLPSYLWSPPAQLVVSGLSPEGYSAGPIEVLDSDTGALISTLEASPDFMVNSQTYSPDGAHLALFGHDRTTGVPGSRVFDTSTWAVERTVPDANWSGPLWLPDSSALVLVTATQGYDPNPTTEVKFLSLAGPALDHTVTIAESCNVFDFSVTDRMALGCNNRLLTASSIDGSDVRTVVGTCPYGSPQPCSQVMAAKFSPSGSRLVMSRIQFDNPNPAVVQLAIAPDQPDAALTPLTQGVTTLVPLAFGWF